MFARISRLAVLALVLGGPAQPAFAQDAIRVAELRESPADGGDTAHCEWPGDPAADARRRVPGKDTERPAADGERESCIAAPRKDDYSSATAVPDRWRIVDMLGYEQHWYDPYNRNTIKGDAPIHGDWFFNATLISDTVYEDRRVPTPVGAQSTDDSGDLDLIGGTGQTQLIQNLAAELVYYKGDTVFKPPDYEFRLTPVFNYNRTETEEILALNVDPVEGTVRHDGFVGLQAVFVDVHLRNVSTRYDFDSVRVGIQPFNADFRGFLFQDTPFGVRLFGTRDNNIFQYNLAWFRRLEKDSNSGLNDAGESLRDDDVFVANLYWQDPLIKGHFLQFTALYNRNREDGEFYFDENGFIQRPASFGGERPRSYDVAYLGFNSDGHIGRLNLTTSLYYAHGSQKNAPFTGEDSDIRALFGAAELSIDRDWMRWRASLLYGSGDDDPFDDEENGFDAIVENPLFAGADTSYWIRQAVPLIGGGRVALSSRNGLLNSLRPSKEHGQSNFTNPGILLLGLGADFDVLPELRVSVNANQLRFDDTAVLEAARQQAGIDEDIGRDLSVSLIYRPLMSQNIVLRASYAVLQPGDGYTALFGEGNQKSVLLNAVLTY